MEYFNNGGPGTALLCWSSPNMPKQPIPPERFVNAYEADCNGNGLLDGCDAGDFDGTGSIDLNDFAAFQSCYSGNRPLDLDTCCSMFDSDYDGRLSTADFALYFLSIGVPRRLGSATFPTTERSWCEASAIEGTPKSDGDSRQ